MRRPLGNAIDTQRAAAAAGGNRAVHREPPGPKREIAEADRIWATQIKAALMANRFRLVQQPIASLVGEDRPMFDLVVRMLDETGQEVLPTEFLAAAERTELMKNIDRWVVGAAMSFCAARKPHRVFVRLSRDSMRDQTLGTWLQQQLKASGVEAGRIVVELSEEMALAQPKEARTLQGLLSALGIELAIEHFGSRRDSAALLGPAARELREDRRRADAGPRQRPAAAGARQGAGRPSRASTASRRSPSASRMRTRWPCCGSSASSSSRATSSTTRKGRDVGRPVRSQAARTGSLPR